MALPVAKQSHRRGRADKLRVGNEHAVDDPKPTRDPAALRTVLVCNVWPDEESALRQYMEDRGASGGGPVDRVERLPGLSCIVVHFKRHDDAVNVVRRDNHKLNGHALSVFLYDKRNRSVYSGNGTLADQEPLLKAEHAVKVPPVDCEAPYTVLIADLHSVTADPIDIIIHEIENHSLEICLATNVNPDMETGIAFVQFQHYEDAARLVMRGHISIGSRSCLGPYIFITVPVFLYQGPLPDDSYTSHAATDQRGADRQTSVQTNTAPEAPPIACDDIATLLPDTPAAQAHGKAGKAQTLQDAMETQTKLFQSRLQTELGRMRTEMEAEMQSEVKRLVSQMGEQLQNQLQLAVGQNRIQMDKMPKTQQSKIARQTENQQGRHSEISRQMDNLRAQLQAEVRLLVNQMERQLRMQAAQQQTDPIELKSQLMSEISKLRTQFRSEATELQIQLRSEVGALRNKIGSDAAVPQAQLRSDVNQLQNQMQAAVSQTQLQSEMHKLVSEITQSLNHLQNQLEETRSLLDVHNQMHTQMLAEVHATTDTQTATDIVTLASVVNQLKSEVDQLKNQIDQIQQRPQKPETDPSDLMNEVSHTELTSEAGRLESQIGTDLSDLQGEVSQYQTQVRCDMDKFAAAINEIKSYITRLESRLRACADSNTKTQESLEMQGRMQAQTIASAQEAVASQTRNEIVTLKGALSDRINELQNLLTNQSRQASGRFEIHGHSPSQPDADREETELSMGIANPSRSTSSDSLSRTQPRTRFSQQLMANLPQFLIIILLVPLSLSVLYDKFMK